MCRHFGAETYLSPDGARAYLTSDAPFAQEGMRLEFQVYEPPIWPQLHGEFMPFTSALDLVLNVGPAALELLRSGRRP